MSKPEKDPIGAPNVRMSPALKRFLDRDVPADKALGAPERMIEAPNEER